MIQEHFWPLALAVGGAALLASPASPLTAATVAGNLLTGAAGSLFHGAFVADEERVRRSFFGRKLEIDENHHILLALRRAHLKALGHVLAAFDSAWPSDPDPARRAEAKRFSKEMTRFLKEAELGREASPGEATELERAVFGNLPGAFEAALAARGSQPPESAINEAKDIRREIEAVVLAELLVETGTSAAELPPSFRYAFDGQPRDGWFDLFVRDGAASLKANPAFSSIWTTEQIARIRWQTDRILRELTVFRRTTESWQRETTENMAAYKDEILAAIGRVAHDKSVDPEHLWPILARLGHTDTPIRDIPRVLGDAVDALIARAGALTVIHNDGAAIDEAIREARAKLAHADVAGALAVIDAALDQDDAYERSLQAEAEARAHRVEMGRARARGFFEKAFIQVTAFDHIGGRKSLEEGLQLDPEAVAQWIALGDEFQTIGKISEARVAYDTARMKAAKHGDEYSLAASHDRIGDVLTAQGDLAAALTSYQASHDIFERLAKADPGNAGRQRNLSVSHNKIGNVQQAQGDLAAALTSYQASLAIAERLAKADPGNAGWQRDLSVSQEKIGDVQQAQGDLAAALTSYQASLTIAERLA